MATSRRPDEFDKAKGRELARLRKDTGLSQEELARAMGISSKQLGKYERGQSRLTTGRFEAALAVIRAHQPMVTGFAESQAPYAASVKETLLRTLRGCKKRSRTASMR